MDEKKHYSLIKTLLKIAEEAGTPSKYNTVITELLSVEGVANVIVKEHKGSPVIIYTNAEGGINVLDNE